MWGPSIARSTIFCKSFSSECSCASSMSNWAARCGSNRVSLRVSLVGSINLFLWFGRWRLRNQAFGLVEQEAKIDPPTPVPFVEANVETTVDKASCPVQLRPGTGIVSKLVERHGPDDPILGRGHGEIGAGNQAALAILQGFGVIHRACRQRARAMLNGMRQTYLFRF